MISCRFRVSLPVLIAASLIGGCAPQGRFPSLASRTMERDLTGGSAPVGCPDGEERAPAPAAADASPAPVPDPQLAARVAELLTTARAGQSTFADALPRAKASSARAGAAGSETWIAAQQDISRLEAARARTVDALAELDALVVQRGMAAVDQAGLDSLTAAAEEVRGIAEAQQAELDRLAGRIREPSARRRAPVPAAHNAQRLAAGLPAPAASGPGHISQAVRPRAGLRGSACRG